MTEEEEDWQNYASTGFGSTDLDLWGDLEVVENQEEDSELDEFEINRLSNYITDVM